MIINKNIIFGAGNLGRIALEKFGISNISYFIDNNKNLLGKFIEGIEVKSLAALTREKNVHVIIASRQKYSMEKQLFELGITDYEFFEPKGFYNTDQLVVNPYLDEGSPISCDNAYKIADVNSCVNKLAETRQRLFNHIEIETINRCNGSCSFCPVSKNIDPRKFSRMEKDLFNKIIEELKNLDYNGKLTLFSNNEPFMDKRIMDFHAYARAKLPKARMHLFTNGTLLTLDRFVELMNYLDELIIDNYNQDLKLIPNCEKIVEYCEKDIALKSRVTIVLRKPQEVLTNRAGNAPNKQAKSIYPDVGCPLPYEQMIVRPDGKVSLCCNDALGQMTMGDLTCQALEEVWFGNEFSKIRNVLQKGRGNIPLCKYCDTLRIL